MRVIPIFVAAFLTGCATSDGVLAPYADAPTDCNEIAAEMLSLAEHDAAVLTARGLKEGAATGVGLAAAAGALPAGWAWAPLAAALAGQVELATHGQRIRYLAERAAGLGCPPLVIE
jgi:hypothetical protein